MPADRFTLRPEIGIDLLSCQPLIGSEQGQGVSLGATSAWKVILLGMDEFAGNLTARNPQKEEREA